ncbi:PucR family transcriptional regulator [Neobacillus drentensis]|uniref:PucR family transcriptional regulator n=1 Tax=Neobacillus drentensis TaxID=220684 RepID=UPI000825FB37|nr:helix-turn-helix domain-containing protein [Neobacillus drentensis]
MNHSLQDKLLNIPLYQLTFLTSLPKEPVYFEKTIDFIPEKWLEAFTIIILENFEQWEKLNKKETTLRLIQDPKLIGLILCEPSKIHMQEDVIQLFMQCQFPIIQLHDSALVSVLKQKNDFLSFSQLSVEIQGFMAKGSIHVAAEMSKALNTPFLYLDQNEQLLWQTGENSDLQAANRWLYNHYKKETTPKKMTKSESPFQAYPIQISESIDHALIASLQTEIWQKKMIDKFSGLLALSLQTQGKFQEQQELFKEHFVYDLLYHKFESQKVMIKQGKVWGWNLEHPHHLLVINISVSEEMTNMNWLDEILSAIEAQISGTVETLIVFPFQDQIIVLLEDGENRTVNQRKKHVAEIAHQLIKLLSSHFSYCRFFIGVGKWYQDSTHLNKSYQEAKMALQFGRIWFKNKNVCHINDLGALRLLIQIHQEVLLDYSEEYLLPLIDSDRESGTEYIKTLQLYIQQKGRINDVSEALFVHPNTLRNRIKKIEEITGIDLQDPEEFMNLMIAVKLLSFMKS